MSKRLHRGLPGLLIHQFREFYYFYLAAFLCLALTHWTQGHLPVLARDLALVVTGKGGEFSPWIFVLLAVGIIFFRTGSRLLFFYPARILQKLLRLEILDILESACPLRYEHHSSGQLFQVISQDMDQLRALIGFALLQVGNIVIALVVLLPKLASFHPRLVEALTPMAVCFILFSLVVSRNRTHYRRSQDAQGEVQNIIIESYLGKKTIKNYHAEKSFKELFAASSHKELWHFYRAGKTIAGAIGLVELGVGLSLVWGGYLIQLENMGAEMLVLFSGFVFLFLEPMMFVSWIGVVLSRSHGSWSRIKELIGDMERESHKEKELKSFPLAVGDSIETVLPFWQTSLKFSFKSHRWHALVGPTGHGKTHLLHLLALKLKNAGHSISLVAQEPYLYNDTIEDNIFLGRIPKEEDLKEAQNWLHLMGLDILSADIKSLLQLEVGENGKRLSGGQAKRLSLVRSLMSHADIILWDDPFSSIDVILEKQIIASLKESPLLRDKTIILSTHRLTTVCQCDDVFYIDKIEGLVEKGNVQTLLTQKGKTYDYFAGQMV